MDKHGPQLSKPVTSRAYSVQPERRNSQRVSTLTADRRRHLSPSSRSPESASNARSIARDGVPRFRMNPRAVLTWMLVCAPAVVSAQDLSRYRDIAFGSSVAIVAAATGSNARGMSILHARPALVEELLWRPQYAIGRPAGSVEAAKEITFRFVDDQLYRVVVLYDARLVEGLSTQDLISAVSEVYGPALPAAALKQAVTPQTVFGGSTVLGRWVSPKHEFTLVRDVLPGTFRLIGASKQLDALASAAVIEATRLDRIDAPRREAERLAEESKARIAAAEKTRATNKDEFRP